MRRSTLSRGVVVLILNAVLLLAVAAPAAADSDFSSIGRSPGVFARAGVPVYADAPDGWRCHFVEGLDALVDDGCWPATGLTEVGTGGVMATLAVSNTPGGLGDLARKARAKATTLWIMGNVEARSTDSPHNGAVFWSGYEEGNKARARDFAVRTGGKTIEMTDAGRWLDENWPYDKLVEVVGQDEADSIWDSVAVRFAVDASGDANAFIYHMRGNPKFRSKTYLRLEKPALLNNPDVTKIVEHE